jgi:hypothetical protein
LALRQGLADQVFDPRLHGFVDIVAEPTRAQRHRLARHQLTIEPSRA